MSDPETTLTLLAGRFRYAELGPVLSHLRELGGRVIRHVDERWA